VSCPSFIDAFTRANGTPGNGWECPSGGYPSAWTINANKLRLTSAGSYLTNGLYRPAAEDFDNVEVSVDFTTADIGSAPEIWLREQSFSTSPTGYMFFVGADYVYIWLMHGGSTTTNWNTSTISTLVANHNYRMVASAANNGYGQVDLSIHVYDLENGNALVAHLHQSDTSASRHMMHGRVGLSGNSSVIDYDNFTVSNLDAAADAISVSKPFRKVASAATTATLTIYDYVETYVGIDHVPYIQTSTTLNVAAIVPASLLPSGGGVKFVLDEGLGGETVAYSTGGSETFAHAFTSVPKGDHTLDVYVVNSSNEVQSGAANHDEAIHIGVGDIFMLFGDSTSAGYPYYDANTVNNWTQATSGNVSTDNRQFPQYDHAGGSQWRKSFLVDLQNAIATNYGYPVLIWNESISGYSTTEVISLLANTNWIKRVSILNPNYWLLDLGINDGISSVAAATFNSHVDSILSALATYGSTAANTFLAKPGYTTDATPQAYELLYCDEIDDIVAAEAASAGPDFNTYFLNHQSELSDFAHPNATGYASKATLWFAELEQIVNVTGTGTISAVAATIASSGTVSISGTASLSAEASTVASTGTVSVTGTGTVIAVAAAVVASGVLTVNCVGTAQSAALTASGAGSVGEASVTGTAVLSSTATTIASSGTLTVDCSGALVAEAGTCGATATVTVQGTATAQAAASTVSGEGFVSAGDSVVGTGTVSAAATTVDSSGTLTVTGSGTSATAASACSGEGYIPIVDGVSALAVAATVAVASGQLIVQGMAVATCVATSVYGSGVAGVILASNPRYERIARNADKQLAKAGQSITIARYAPSRNSSTGVVTKGAATASGTANAVEIPVTQALMGTFASQCAPGTLVSKTVRALKVSALLGFLPQSRDEVTLADGTVWPVVGVTPVNPAGVPIVYTVGVAK